MNNVELYWNNDHTCYAVLVSHDYGAGFSSWGAPELAYDKRIVEFWLAHKNNKEWMSMVDNFEWKSNGKIIRPASIAYKEASQFFKSIGYDRCPCMNGFAQIELEWVPRGSKWRISEYDGAESIEYETEANWNCF